MEKVYINSEIVELPIGNITPFEGSHNVDEVVDMVAESISKYGLQQPITIDKDNVIITGHSIYKALLKLGYTSVPCSYATHLSDDEVAQYRIADNKTSEFATWNEKKLKKEISCMKDASNMQFAFDENLMAMVGMDEKIVKSITPTLPSVNEKAPTPSPSMQEQRDRIREEVQRQDSTFKEQIKNTESSMSVKAAEYLEYICSKCQRKVIVKL